jgi:hypothetical protein
MIKYRRKEDAKHYNVWCSERAYVHYVSSSNNNILK